jgi:hypothetical protein
MASLLGASAFAESRPSQETSARREAGGRISRDRAESGASARRGDDSRNRSTPAQSRVEVRGDRDRGSSNRSNGGRIERDRSRDTNRDQSVGGDRSTRNDNRDRGSVDRNRSTRNDNGTWRGDSRSRGTSSGNGSYRNDNRPRDTGRYGRDNRQTFNHSGRVHRVYPYGGGYRVWLTGCNYPFYIPSAYYHRDRFRVGLTIALGGFYNSRGYYDYYDDNYRDGYYDRSTSRGELRGIVESVDDRRETFVVRNDATGSFVTIVMRDRGRDPVRAGDFVELRGDWTRDGVFEAYRVDIVDYERR